MNTWHVIEAIDAFLFLVFYVLACLAWYFQKRFNALALKMLKDLGERVLAVEKRFNKPKVLLGRPDKVYPLRKVAGFQGEGSPVAYLECGHVANLSPFSIPQARFRIGDLVACFTCGDDASSTSANPS
jgi:hypothetical protein